MFVVRAVGAARPAGEAPARRWRRGLRDRRRWDGPSRTGWTSVWPALTKIAIDHAVAEPAAAAGRVAVVPGDFGWDDVGDFASLGALLADADDVPG